MKKDVILTILFVIFALSGELFAQEADSSWVYKVNYNVVEQTADSNLFDTDVSIVLNTMVVMDSSTIILKVGTQEGQSDLFYKEYLYSPAIETNPDVSKQGATLQFYLGRFAMPAEHYPAALEILVN